MMNRPRMFKVVRCEECPHWLAGNFPRLNDYCELAECNLTGMVKIPSWCPLSFYPENENET